MNPLQSTREEMRELVVPLSARANDILHLYERIVNIVDNADRCDGVHDLVFLAKRLYHEANELENVACKIKVLAECARDRLVYLDPNIKMEE